MNMSMFWYIVTVSIEPEVTTNQIPISHWIPIGELTIKGIPASPSLQINEGRKEHRLILVLIPMAIVSIMTTDLFRTLMIQIKHVTTVRTEGTTKESVLTDLKKIWLC